MPLKIAVLLSGSGTTLQNLIDRAGSGELDVQFVCVIGSRTGAYGLERARKHDIPAIPIVRKDYGSLDEFNAAIWDTVRRHGAELVVLAGFMSLLQIPGDYENRVINVHPALIPAFCGKGMYGHHVHEAVIEYGVKLSGATVHFANNIYDAGPIILQDAVPVLDNDTPDTLAERVQAKERELYPKAIRLFAEGRLRVEGRRVRILDPQ
ncbi:MAG TPA: phosphoribosylglycinamide formyltransferase [Candidatus Hydrogenedentes bacterium]|jgi:formyltetrahydrofolate-dependent phosphoribosylglycinamide formyltransferase|nr:phosphoribosylglycinamide formyltransferase [Candidatus Hydrogenedentota bacterium]HPJ99899.1 phosphoribosylglycinamide formyltransferase [Candidatus Hydrogenedentota bacterium]